MLATSRLQSTLAAVLCLTLATAAMAAPAATSEDGRVDINTATAEQLETLPGIGPAIARRIVEYREANGPFKAPEELMNVKGIGEKSFLSIKDRIRIGRSPGQ